MTGPTVAPVGRHNAAVTDAGDTRNGSPGVNDERESLVNDRRHGPANQITPKVEEVASIHAFMIDIDCGILDPAVFSLGCVESPAELYEKHVRFWLDRDPVLRKAQVRDSGHGLHILLWLDEPIVCCGDDVHDWDAIACGIRNVMPGDPNLNGLIALTRPVGATNSKHDPPRQVCLLRPGDLVSLADVLDLNRRITEQPARLWMRVFFGGERAEPCPFCGKGSLGVAGGWQVRCYECGRMDAASIVYRCYSPEFLKQRMEANHG